MKKICFIILFICFELLLFSNEKKLNINSFNINKEISFMSSYYNNYNKLSPYSDKFSKSATTFTILLGLSNLAFDASLLAMLFVPEFYLGVIIGGVASIFMIIPMIISWALYGISRRMDGDASLGAYTDSFLSAGIIFTVLSSMFLGITLCSIVPVLYYFFPISLNILFFTSLISFNLFLIPMVIMYILHAIAKNKSYFSGYSNDNIPEFAFVIKL